MGWLTFWDVGLLGVDILGVDILRQTLLLSAGPLFKTHADCTLLLATPFLPVEIKVYMHLTKYMGMVCQHQEQIHYMSTSYRL